jgi:hypothetical protein
MEDTMMRKNHASLSTTLAASVLLLSAASSWANDVPTPPLQPVAAASLPAPAVATPPAPIRLAWDRVGIAAFGIGA